MDAGKIAPGGGVSRPDVGARPVEASTPQDSVALGSTDSEAVRRAALAKLLKHGTPPTAAHVFWQSDINDMRKNSRGGGFLPARPVVTPDGHCYVGTNRGELIAFDPEGKPEWRKTLGEVSPYNDPTLGWDGALVLTNEHDTRLLCLEPDGSVRYDTNLPEMARSRPEVDPQGRVFVIGDSGLHATHPDGTHAWSVPNPAQYCGFFLRPDGSAMVYGVDADAGSKCKLQCVSPEGKVLWGYTHEGRPGGMPATGPDGETIISDTSRVKIFDAGGHQLRSLDLGSDLDEPLVDPDGHIFVASQDGQIRSLDMNLQENWRVDQPGAASCPLALGPDGTLYATSVMGRVHAFDGKDGSRRWTCDVSEQLPAQAFTRVLPAPDGTVFVRGEKKVHVLDRDGLRRGNMGGEDYLTASREPLLNGRLAVTDLDRVYLIGPADWLENLPDPPKVTHPTGDVKRVGDWVIINGVRVPVRKQKA